MNLHAPTPFQLAALKVLVLALCLVPAALLAHGWFAGTLGANPIETLQRGTGEWTLNMLLVTLAVTPLRRLTGLHWLQRLRRMLGLVAFAWACAHLANWAWLDLWFDWGAIAADILKRPYVTVGFAAFVLLLPLAATSNAFAIRRLGGRRWQALHRSVYAIAILGVVHYWWLVKADVLKPLIYALVLAALLGVRAWWRELERRRQIAAGAPQFKGKVIRILR
ncbi:protein-methionine-sulfoxide reductase heme-binding subunit MsrQ [Pseudothauera rhizosphaerae]|uniref:Protein-methionine-sulfoxide reductase heme-binding subunit MsrQ n=1 Tax=Pseudothauera rhizosphaerae TaxID=2565932 RepID=A0A4S4AM94_9RHOO|nr:protein-methionine-sulfoxide reductase heme-binding subunit MsrQ [Pseudothauera rhizosphaerae]THF60720.1 sulfoxide reductase heme-binding subunit YedZ [Pseudothauera rhizosphaerae]